MVLRPLERRILRLHEQGVEHAEIGRRFRRSADHVRRVIEMTQLPGRTGERPSRGVLRPLERRVLRWRDAGVGYAEIGAKFRRSPGHIRRVEGLARIKQAVALLSDQAIS